MLNENATHLKAQLKALHQNLAETGEVDEEWALRHHAKWVEAERAAVDA